MTKVGFGFIMAGGFVYLLASQTQIGWLYLFDAIIGSLLVLSVILPWWSLRSLRIERQVLFIDSSLRYPQLGGFFEDEIVEVRLKVTNHGRLPRHFIKVLEDCPFAEADKQRRAFFLTSINPGSTTVFSYIATCYRRGYYPSASAVLQSSEPLGMAVRRRPFPLPLNLTVYPAYYEMEGVLTADASRLDWGGATKARAAGEFRGTREFQYGDPLKHIHWRNSARLGRFVLKEFEQASQGSLAVVFETGRDFGAGRETTLEYSIRITASLAKSCADSGRRMDVIAGETPLYDAGWREVMDYLARLTVDGKTDLTKLVAGPRTSQVIVVVAPAAETELTSALSQLADRARELVVILLEGFAPDELPEESLPRLKGSNCHIIRCRRGNLEAAVKDLGEVLSLGGKSAAPAG